MNQTRVFLLFAWLMVATLLWMEWGKFNAPMRIDAATPTTQPAATSSVPGASSVPMATQTSSVAGVPSLPANTQPAAPVVPASSNARRVTVTSDLLKVTLDGGSVLQVDLLKYPQTKEAGSPPVRLFTDELRCPITVEDLAAQLWEVVLLPPEQRAGVWHLAGPEAVSRYALGVMIALRHGVDPSAILPALSASALSPRPRDLRLLTPRADRELRIRARPISAILIASR